MMNSSLSDRPRSSIPNASFSTSILTDDPEAKQYNLFLSAALRAFVKLWMAETTFETAASLFFI